MSSEDIASFEQPEKEPTIKAIDKSVAEKICHGQVITCLASAVKELIENSLDAGATFIEVKLIDNRLESIEVSDNGSGIHENDYELLCTKGSTSKILSIDDLTHVTSFGFRGEALSAACSLCEEVSVFTKTVKDAFGTVLNYDRCGRLVKRSRKAKNVGTTVSLKALFSTYVVRQKHMRKQQTKQFSEVIQLLNAYALAIPSLKMICYNNTRQVFNYTSEKFLSAKLGQVLKPVPTHVEFVQSGIIPEVAEEFSVELEKYAALREEFSIIGYISETGYGASSSDKQFISVNNRPVILPKLAKVINQVFRSYDNATSSVYPFFALSIKLPQNRVDVNVTPDKRTILLVNENMLFAIVKSSLLKMYGEDAFSLKNSRYDQSSSQMTIISELNTTPTNAMDDFEIEDCEITDDITFAGKGQKRPLEQQAQTSSQRRRITDFFEISVSESDFANTDPIANSTTVEEVFEKNCDLNEDEFEPDEVLDDPYLMSRLSETPQNNSNADISVLENNFFQNNEIPTRQPSAGLSDFASPSYEPDIFRSPAIPRQRRQSSESGAAKSPAQRKRWSSGDSGGGFRTGGGFVKASELPPLGNVSREFPSPVPQVSRTTKITSSRHAQHGASMSAPVNGNPATSPSLSPRTSSSTAVAIMEEEPRGARQVVPLRANLEEIRLGFQAISVNKSPLVTDTNDFNADFEDEHAEAELKRELHKASFKDMKIIGQFNKSFILAQLGKNVFVIDQHASDERYNYDNLMYNEFIETQPLVSPMPLFLTSYKESLLEDCSELFAKNGFKFVKDNTKQAGQRYGLKTIPTVRNENYRFGVSDVEEMLEALMDSVVMPKNYRPRRVNEMLQSKACRMFIMIDDALPKEKMRMILDHMSETNYPWTCAHGRPTIRHLLKINEVFDDENYKYKDRSDRYAAELKKLY